MLPSLRKRATAQLVRVGGLSGQQLRWKRTAGKPSNQNGGDRNQQQQLEHKTTGKSDASRPGDFAQAKEPSSTASPSKEETKFESTLKTDKAPFLSQKDATSDNSLSVKEPNDPQTSVTAPVETKKEMPSRKAPEEVKPSFSSTVTQRDPEPESLMNTSTKEKKNWSVGEVPSNTPPPWMSAPSSTSLQDMRRMLEQVAGVEEIAALKEAVIKASDRLDAATLRVQEMRQQLDENTLKAQEISTQHAAMMQNRSSWNEQDVQTFAQLTAAEGKARQFASTSRQAVRQAEDEMQKSLRDYMDALRRRYHEEQVWQDKWRVLGTYWTWSLIALNSVVFFVGQALHYRREERRMLSIQEMFREYATRAESSAASAVSQKKTIETAKPAVKVESKEHDVKKTSKKLEDGKRKRIKATDKPKKASTETSITMEWKNQWQVWTQSTGTLLQMSGRVVQHQLFLWRKVTLRAMGTSLKASQRTVLNLWDGTIQTTKAGASKLVDASKVSATATKHTAEDIWRNKRVQKMWTKREELMKQVHWPSVAVGAVASSLGLFLLSSSRPK